MANRYNTDLTDSQWQALERFFPPPKKMGRPKTHSPRRVLDAIFYLTKTGCHWRMLPHDFPPWSLVYKYFSRWSKSGLLKEIHDELHLAVRMKEGREPQSTAAIIDSQSAKVTDTCGSRGFDAGKKVKGRKRHILVDTIGLLLAVVVHTADIQDRDRANLVFDKIDEYKQHSALELVWADGGYAGQLVERTSLDRNFELEIVKRSDDAQGFKILPRRWVVERTFSWLDRNRRLSKDYERMELSSEAIVYLGMTKLMLNRLFPA